MDFYPSFIQFYLLLLLSIGMCYTVGHIFLSAFIQPQESNYRIFQKLIIGQTLIITIYAIIKSGGNTTYLLVVLIGLLFLAYCKFKKWQIIDFNRTIAQIKAIEYKPIIAIVISSVVFYLIQYSKFVDIHGNLHHLWTDPLFYVRVGNILNATGKETTANFLPSFANLHKPTFGHYYESWNSALFSWLFNISGQYAMMLVYFPLTFSIVYIGAVALTKKYTAITSDYLIYILAYLIIVIAPIRALVTPIANYIGFDTTNKYNLIYATVQKFSIIYIYFIWFLIEFKKAKDLTFVFPLFLISIIYPIVLPGIFVSIIFYLLLLILKKIAARESKVILVHTIIILVAFAGFYYINHEISIIKQHNITLWSVIKEQIIALTFFKYQIIHPFEIFFSYLIAFSPYLVLVLIIRKDLIKIRNVQTILILLILIIPLIGWDLIYYIWDTDQLFSNIFTPITNIIIFIGLMYVAQQRKRYLIVYIFMLFILNIFQTVINQDFKVHTYIVHEKEYTGLINDIKKKECPNFAVIVNSSYVYYMNPSYLLQRISNHIFVENITWREEAIENSRIDKYTENKYIVNTSFYRFVCENNMSNDIVRAQLQFIKSAKINYLIANESTKIGEPVMQIVDTIFILPSQQMIVYRLRIP